MIASVFSPHGQGSWLVKGTVDAKHTLGMTLTQHYECTFLYTGPPVPGVSESFKARDDLELTCVMLGK